jgi:aminoglycoside phosphotransferase family enzyme
MQRLPAERMLDQVIARGELRPTDIDAIAGMLVAFYRSAARARVDEVEYVQRLRNELADSRNVLERPEFSLLRALEPIDRADHAITRHEGLLRRRVAEGRILDGHGDLRPEHVALVEPPVVIDALEFDERMREVDPFDELSYLGLECAMCGDSRFGPKLQARLASELKDSPPPEIPVLHTARRALLRARLSAAHLLDAEVRAPGKWLPQAARYLVHARAALDFLERDVQG